MTTTAIQPYQSPQARGIVKFQKLDPKIWFDKKGKWLFCYMELPLNAGFSFTFRAVVDLEKVEDKLRSGAPGVEGIFGAIFGGIKKAISVVGKVTGVGKLLGGATKVLTGPIGQMIPGVGTVAGALNMGKSIATAMAAKKAGQPKVASQALALATVQARKYELSQPQQKEAQAFGAKIYKLVISPS
jgi:hypothetical protein